MITMSDNIKYRGLLILILSCMGMTMQAKIVERDIRNCRKVENLKGQKFGLLQVIDFVGKTQKRTAVWLCRCECGKEISVQSGNLKRGRVSCGCDALRKVKEACTTHGMTKSSEWNIWKGARKRCRLESDPAYYKYGGAGINMCDEWYDSFEKFYADMGPRPKGLTLDREDNDLGYFKENCRWATYTTQNRNKRSNHLWEFNGEKKCITEWSRSTGIRKDTLRRRVCVYGWTVERALTTHA